MSVKPATLARSCRVDVFRNNVEMVTRVTHLPTGIVVSVEEPRDEKAQREECFRRLAVALEIGDPSGQHEVYDDS